MMICAPVPSEIEAAGTAAAVLTDGSSISSESRSGRSSRETFRFGVLSRLGQVTRRAHTDLGRKRVQEDGFRV